MPFIHGVSLQNFKIFKEKVNLNFSPLTILTGTNGSGKSSVNQALILLKRIFDTPITEIGHFKYDADKINFQQIIKRIPLELLDKRIATFNNLVYNDASNDIIEFAVPANLIDHGNKLEIVIKYKIHENGLQSADLESFALRDVELDISVFEIYKKIRKQWNTSGYFCRLNYLYFYEIFREESRIYQQIREVANEVFIVDDEQIIKSHPRRDEFIGLLNKFFGSVRPGLVGEKGSYDLVDSPNISEFLEDNFSEFKQSLEKDFRTINEFSRKTPEDASLFSFDHLIPDEHRRFEFLSNIKNENKNIDTFTTKYQIKLLELLSEHEFHVATYFSPKSNDIGISTGTSTSLAYPTDALYETCRKKLNLDDYTTEEIKNDASILIYGQRNEVFQFTEYGDEFFRLYVYRRIARVINNAFVFRFIQFNFAKGDLMASRLIDLTNKEIGTNQVLEFINKSHEFSDKLKDFTNVWIKKFGIGEEIYFKNHGAYTEIHIKKNEKIYNLADEGLGISKLTPVLIQIINIAHNNYDSTDLTTGSTLLLEEPEAGLHPALQSQLAEFLFDAYKKFNIQFIIETHSEYLIRKLQTMVADTSNSMKPEDAIVYYFYHPDNVPEGSKQVVSINIQSDGSLSRNFGTGFFDESSNLNIALYKLTKASQN